jgi:hypothetical protein
VVSGPEKSGNPCFKVLFQFVHYVNILRIALCIRYIPVDIVLRNIQIRMIPGSILAVTTSWYRYNVYKAKDSCYVVV